jgi:hypothetical protein
VHPASTARRFAAAAALAVALVAGCGGDGHVPAALVDGARPPPVPAALTDLDHALMTRLELVRGRELEHEPVVECIGQVAGGAPTMAAVRTTATGRSATFATRDGRGLFGCDGAARSREASGPWCGYASAPWGRRLADGRLDLANCIASDRSTVAFAWIQSLPGARWLVVEQDGYPEVYEVRGALPVRVATTHGIDEETSSVSIRVASYRVDGRKLGEQVVDLQVAG